MLLNSDIMNFQNLKTLTTSIQFQSKNNMGKNSSVRDEKLKDLKTVQNWLL